MEFLIGMLGLIFLICLLGCFFFKIRNIIILKELKCKELYRKIKESSKNRKFLKTVFIISLIVLIICVQYIYVGLPLAVFAGFVLAFFALINADVNPPFNIILIALTKFVKLYFMLFKYFIYAILASIYLLVIQNFITNILDYKTLKKHIKNSDVEQKNISNKKSNIKAIGATVLIIIVVLSITLLLQIAQANKLIDLVSVNTSFM